MTNPPASTALAAAAVLAQAAWKDLNAKQSQYQAAALRSEVKPDNGEAETIRREAHDLLDSCLDLNAEAARAQMAAHLAALRR